MKKRSSFLLIYIIYWIFACKGQSVDNIRGANWLSIDYIESMKNHLPCECIDSINYLYYISIASKFANEEEHTPQGVLNYVAQTEPIPFYILFENSEKYIISIDSETMSFELTLRGDTLLLTDSLSSKKFVKSIIPFDFIENANALYLDNISLLNESLLSRGYPTMQIILKEDSLGLDCNAWLGNVNMIYSYKTQKSWVLEIKNEKMHIKEVLNPRRDPLDPIRTTDIVKLQWIISKKR